MKKNIDTLIHSLVVLILLLVGCSKDKNMEEYRREKLQEKISRINSVSGTYSGPMISKIDGSNLGIITLNFQARTDIQSTIGQGINEQRATVSGSLNFKSFTSAEIVFNNGFYDDTTGDFQVSIPIVQEGGISSTLSLIGMVIENQWNGIIEVNGQPDFGGQLKLQKKTSQSQKTNIEGKIGVGGIRLEQISKVNYIYEGSYLLDDISTPFKLSFINRDLLPEQHFYKLFSPVRNVSISCDFTDFELNFPNALIDDKAGTLVAQDPIDQRGNAARATISCLKFGIMSGEFGWNCQVQTRLTTLNLHLIAKKQGSALLK